MLIKRTLLLVIAMYISLSSLPSYGGDIISCNGFESCPEADTSALEARIEALEALLAGATRGIDSSTSQDTLTFGNSISGEAVLSRELSTTGREGNLPVCYNGAGELLPCADGVEPPPPVDPYLGSWTGRMIYDRRSTGACHDADVLLNIVEYADYYAPDVHWKINSITVIRDTGGLAIADSAVYIPETGFSVGYFFVFGGQIDLNLQFSPQGTAQGYWNYYNGDCYGQWSFTKD